MQANVLNGQGIVTALYDGGWRAWGNNMACYPTTPTRRTDGLHADDSFLGGQFIYPHVQEPCG
ncbi:MAG: hypothetical protein ACLR78_14135 [Roseburia sp.]